MGILHPIMGTKQNTPPPRASLADALFPKVRQRVLAVLFDAPERSFYMGEVIALAHSGTGAVQRELAGLAAAGILTVQKLGNQKHYQANAETPIFEELRDVVGKSIGVVNVLRTVLTPLTGQISSAYVYDEAAITAGSTPPAVQVVVFSSGLGDGDGSATGAVAAAMQGAANTLARQVSFTLYTEASFATAVQSDGSLLKRLMQPSKTWLMGSEDQLFTQAS